MRRKSLCILNAVSEDPHERHDCLLYELHHNSDMSVLFRHVEGSVFGKIVRC